MKKGTKLIENCPDPEEKTHRSEEPAVAYSKRYSYLDYLSWADDKMRELLNGIVYTLSAPFRNHAEFTSNFMVKAGSYIAEKKGKCKIYHAPFDVRLSLNGETADKEIFNVVQPDICVVCDASKLDEKGCLGAPDLIVEVISPSTAKKDLNEKFNLYEAAGVCEYWVVYPKDKGITVFLLQEDGKYDPGTTYQLVGEKVCVPVHTLEGLVIDLNELFEP